MQHVRHIFIRGRQQTINHQVGESIRPKDQTQWSEARSWQISRLGLTSLVLRAWSKAFPNKWRRCSPRRSDASSVPTDGDHNEHATRRN